MLSLRKFVQLTFVMLVIEGSLAVLIAGCHSGKKHVAVVETEPQPQFPLTSTGLVTGNHDSTVWVETISHEVYEYNLCSGPNLLADGEGGTIVWSWNSKDECYVEQSATHNPALDKQDD